MPEGDVVAADLLPWVGVHFVGGHKSYMLNKGCSDADATGGDASLESTAFRRHAMCNELILIIDDDRETRALLKFYLEREGYRTVEASDGEIGLAHHMKLKPDLVMLEVSLPRRNGFEVLAEIRRRGDTLVIVVTCRDKPIDELQGYRCGADDYIIKPFEPDVVVARTTAVLRRAGGRIANLPIRLGN
ncbi:response regulator transcription factor [Rhizobium binae]|uniref:response regulator transcription factor n=1 Tax=Rhizobium binae TaxID=1138190 RepID=UPI00287FBD57|nr:response regulator [Rhizobium binae]